jgi:hypothetical protein
MQRLPAAVVECLGRTRGGFTRGLFEQNLAEKMWDLALLADISPLLSDGYTWDPAAESTLTDWRVHSPRPPALGANSYGCVASLARDPESSSPLGTCRNSST